MADLVQVSGDMQRAQLASGGSYPTTLPTTIVPSPNVTLNLKYSGSINYYGTILSVVQNGVLMS